MTYSMISYAGSTWREPVKAILLATLMSLESLPTWTWSQR